MKEIIQHTKIHFPKSQSVTIIFQCPFGMADAVQHESVPNNEEPHQINLHEKETAKAENPLNHESVIEKLLSFFPLADLKSGRLVNSLWNRSAIPYLKRKCGYINFNSSNHYTRCINHGLEDMVQFIQCMGASSSFPYVRLEVSTSLVGKQEDEAILLNFFRSISPVVTELAILNERRNNLFSTNIPENLEFPSLETFSLVFHTGNVEDRNFKFISSILTHAPVLDKIALVDKTQTDGNTVTRFLNSITTAKCFKISDLGITAHIGNDHLIFLSNMGLKLKTLRLDFWGWGSSLIDKESLKMFFQSQSTTLQKLKLVDSRSSGFPVEFPCMTSLKTLIIKGSSHEDISFISFPNISYVQQFPALKRIAISNDTDEWWWYHELWLQWWKDFFKLEIQPTITVEALKLTEYFLDVQSFPYAGHVFPNIKILEVPAILQILNIAYDTMPNIEELILDTTNVALVDDIITGISITECQQINTLFHGVFQYSTTLITWRGTTPDKPVSCLKRLKILRLKCEIQTDPVELTDVSCRLVLMDMESLQCVDFWGRCPPTDMISNEVLLEMRKRFMVLC